MCVAGSLSEIDCSMVGVRGYAEWYWHRIILPVAVNRAARKLRPPRERKRRRPRALWVPTAEVDKTEPRTLSSGVCLLLLVSLIAIWRYRRSVWRAAARLTQWG
jgi:hypothetical protein